MREGWMLRSLSGCMFQVAIVLIVLTLGISVVPLIMAPASSFKMPYQPVAAMQSMRLILDMDDGYVTEQGTQVVVLINGKAVKAFSAQEMTLSVRHQDRIEIDSALKELVRVRVKEVSPGILSPREGDWVVVQHSIEVLGNVIGGR
jgi:hypothetical protein